MKNLIIIGIPRAGKTALAKSVAQKIGATGYATSMISADALIGGLTQIRKRNFFYATIYRPVKHIIPFMARSYKISLVRDLHNMVARFLAEQADVSTVIYEDAYLTPWQAVRIFDKKRFKIVAIGYPNADIHQKMADIRQFDGASPANRKDDAALQRMITNLVNNSRRLAHDAEKLGIPFIDTSTNYHGEINKFTDNVLNFLAD